MKNQDNMFSLKSINLVELFSNGNYLDEPQDTEFKRTIMNLIKDAKAFKEDRSRELNELKEGS